MTFHPRPRAGLGLLVLLACSSSTAREPGAFDALLENADERAGLVTLHVDRRAGKVWLELPAGAEDAGTLGDFLYVEGLATGLGSLPVGLDRGQLGPSRLVTLRVQGARLLVEQQNLGFRARSDDPAQVAAARESFAPSVLWAGPIAARADDGRGLVDITSFLVRDAHGVVASLRGAEQGDYALDADRSAIDIERVLVFPDNVEFEVLLTYRADKPGDEVAAVAPSGTALSLVQRISLARLPDDGYAPRAFDPRAGSFPIVFRDYAAPLDQSITTRWIVRHRLRPGEPLVYYVDPAIPEPVRGAVIEGASWWAEAFAAAGFSQGFEVRLLPADVHPLDLRYNVIQWVHRATRGWSYGYGATDPRTGEMIKAHVNLESLRVRHDRLLFEGLLGTAKTGSGDADDPIQLSLARIRQLAAHEVGHSLGFAHNFAASAADRASVMDYPAPLLRVTDGAIDASGAYARGIGAWDRIAARYAYSVVERDAGADPERAALDEILAEADAQGLRFLSDADARGPGAAHPLANLWDNGRDPVAALAEALAVRRIAVGGFGTSNLPAGAPLAELEEVFATVYFHHRYQLEAALKSVGGLRYGYPLRDDDGGRALPLDGPSQRAAIGAVLAALAPAALDIPEPVLTLLVPRAFGIARNPEQFDSRTAPAFDALGAARTAADLVVSGLLQRERAARLIDQHRRDPRLPGFSDVLDALIEASFARGARDPRVAAIERETQRVVVARLIGLVVDAAAADGVRAEAERALRKLSGALRGDDAHAVHLRGAIARLFARPTDDFAVADVPTIPPGSPIGCAW